MSFLRSLRLCDKSGTLEHENGLGERRWSDIIDCSGYGGTHF